MRRIILLLFLIHATATAQINSLYYTNTGKISFKSESKQELIAASSDEMQGIIDEEKKLLYSRLRSEHLMALTVHYNRSILMKSF